MGLHFPIFLLTKTAQFAKIKNQKIEPENHNYKP